MKNLNKKPKIRQFSLHFDSGDIVQRNFFGSNEEKSKCTSDCKTLTAAGFQRPIILALSPLLLLPFLHLLPLPLLLRPEVLGNICSEKDFDAIIESESQFTMDTKECVG